MSVCVTFFLIEIYHFVLRPSPYSIKFSACFTLLTVSLNHDVKELVEVRLRLFMGLCYRNDRFETMLSDGMKMQLADLNQEGERWRSGGCGVETHEERLE